MFQKMSVGTASFYIAVMTFGSYIIGLVRDKLLAYYFGTTTISDIYNAAFIIPDLILNACILGALSGVFIPIFMSAIKEGDEAANEAGSVFLFVLSGVVLLVSLIAMFFAPSLATVLLPSTATPETLDTLARMMQIMLIYPVIVGISNTIGAILQSYRHFMSYGLSAIVYNIGIIAGVVVFHDTWGIYSAAVGVLAGFLMHMGVRLFELKYVAFRLVWPKKWLNAYFLQTLKTMPPRVVTLLSTYILLFLSSVVGFALSEGAIAASVYARNFQSFAISIFGISLATAVLPALSGFHVVDDKENFVKTVQKSIQEVLFFTVPAMIGLIFVAPHLISFILGGGKFSGDSVGMTSGMLVIFALSIPFESMMHVMSRVFYAKKHVWVPMVASIIFLGIGTTILFYGQASLGVWTLPTAWSVGAIAQSIFLLIMYSVSGIRNAFSVTTFVEVGKIIVGSLVMAFVLWMISKNDFASLVMLVLMVVAGGAVYASVMYMLRSTALHMIVQKLRK